MISSGAKASKTPGLSFKIYDAVIDSNASESNADPEMEKFESMLRDYLTGISIFSLPSWYKLIFCIVNDPTETTEDSSTAADSSLEDDYVYDIFYYRRRLAASELAAAPAIATVKGLPSNSDDEGFSSESEIEDEADEDSNGECVIEYLFLPFFTGTNTMLSWGLLQEWLPRRRIWRWKWR